MEDDITQMLVVLETIINVLWLRLGCVLMKIFVWEDNSIHAIAIGQLCWCSSALLERDHAHIIEMSVFDSPITTHC